MSVLAMHPFLQHFNNIFKTPTLVKTFQQCAEQLNILNNTLNVQILSAVPVQIIQQEFSGIKAIKQQELQPIWTQFSTAPIDRKASKQELLLKANYFLSYLLALRRLLNLSDESLITGAQRLAFSQEYAKLQNNGDVQIYIIQLQLNLYGEQLNTSTSNEDFFRKMEADFADLLLSFQVLYDEEGDKNLYELINCALKQFNIQQLVYNEIPAKGCEKQIQKELLYNLMNLTQRYFVPQQRRVQCNCLVELLDLTSQLAEILNSGVLEGLVILVGKSAEAAIFNLRTLSKQQFFSYYLFMLIGELKIMNEQEFYLQTAAACDSVVKVVNFIFPASLQCKNFTAIMSFLVKLVKSHSVDKINVDFTYQKIELFDKDVNAFVKFIGGIRNGFASVLEVYLLGKSIFETTRSILDFISMFLYEIIRPNGVFQEKIALLSDEAKQLQLLGDEYDVQVLLSKVGSMIAQ